MKTTNKKTIKPKAVDFDVYLAKELKDKKAKRLFDKYGRQLEIAYQILQLRQRKKMSQQELAKKIGTTQGNIARIESGRQNFTINFLQKIAVALDCNLQINFSA